MPVLFFVVFMCHGEEGKETQSPSYTQSIKMNSKFVNAAESYLNHTITIFLAHEKGDSFHNEN